MKEYNQMDLDELAQEMSRVEDILKETRATKETLDIEENTTRREILEKELFKNKIKEGRMKAGYLIKDLLLKLEQLKRIYWNKKI